MYKQIHGKREWEHSDGCIKLIVVTVSTVVTNKVVIIWLVGYYAVGEGRDASIAESFVLKKLILSTSYASTEDCYKT